MSTEDRAGAQPVSEGLPGTNLETTDEPDSRFAIPVAEQRRREEIGGGRLRSRTARGSIVNGSFMIALNLLGMLKGVAAAAFLTTTEYGVWGILLITLTGLITLKRVGVSDKFIQQDEVDQERAFQRAFTNDLIVSAVLSLILVMTVPLLVLAYGERDLAAPAFVLALVIPALALQAPIWVFYRRMQFVKQRTLQSIDPFVSFVLTVAFAVAGFGYWSLVVGTVIGAWAAAVAAMIACPYPLRLSFDRSSLRSYVSFSWPLFLVAITAVVMAQASLFVGNLAFGLAGVGAIALAGQVSLYTTKLDSIVSQTLYPAICAAKDRLGVLQEAFLKSNRIALLMGIPFGIGIFLFTPDLISFGIGEKWRPAEGLIQVTGAIAAINQIGFNWNTFYQARGETRPTAVAALVMLAGFSMLALPLLAAEGLTEYGIGMAVATLMLIGVRMHYLRRLFPELSFLGHAVGSLAPTAIAVLAVGAIRVAVDGRTLGLALFELAVFVLTVGLATLVQHRSLVREMVGYLRSRPELRTPAPASSLPRR